MRKEDINNWWEFIKYYEERYNGFIAVCGDTISELEIEDTISIINNSCEGCEECNCSCAMQMVDCECCNGGDCVCEEYADEDCYNGFLISTQCFEDIKETGWNVEAICYEEFAILFNNSFGMSYEYIDAPQLKWNANYILNEGIGVN
jgi:hypothetical protein